VRFVLSCFVVLKVNETCMQVLYKFPRNYLCQCHVFHSFHFFIHFPFVPILEHRAHFGVSVITHTRHTVGLLWTCDQPVADMFPMLRDIFESL
jgi:hypothetical protein